MIQTQLKLRLTDRQERILDRWLWHLTGAYNWAIRKIELDAKDRIYHSPFDFQNLAKGHSSKVGVPSHTIQGTLSQAYQSWQKCFKKKAKAPRLKGIRNRLNSIPFPDPIKLPEKNRIGLPGLKSVKFFHQDIPSGKIKCGRLVKKASGWWLCLFIDAQPQPIPKVANGRIGIDPGFKNLLTLSTGEKIEHPRELEESAKRLAQAQRGNNRELVSKIQEKIANQRKDRNHKLSRRVY